MARFASYSRKRMWRTLLAIVGGTALIVIGARLSFQVPTGAIESIYASWKDDFIPTASSRSMRREQKSLPCEVSTS